MSRAFTSCRPATLPEPVLRQRREMLEFGSAGASIAISVLRTNSSPSRSDRGDLRKLLSIPDDYAVLFTSGGATTTQALLPLNFAAAGQPVDYVVTGHWGKTALKQAKPYAATNVAATSEADGFRSIPARASWNLSPDAAYVHITANETIHGVEFRDLPETGSVPLVADFSAPSPPTEESSKFGAIYAARRRTGPFGIGVLIGTALLDARPAAPDIFDSAP